MTIGELREYLEEFDDDVEVRLAQQPSWPFEYDLDGVKCAEVDGVELVYLTEGQQLRYLPEEVKDELGWG